ncbi:MAG: VWA domain-containing protein [Bacilli bacterium]|nr:VWA domain-containing protein [Bacilli bacterium]
MSKLENLRNKVRANTFVVVGFIVVMLLALIATFTFSDEILKGDEDLYVEPTPSQIGTLKNAKIFVGDSEYEGNVKLSEEVEKIANTKDKFLVSVSVEGKESKKTKKPMYITVIMDSSGSMEDCTKYNGRRCSETKWDAAKASVKTFANEMLTNAENVKIALITFAEGATVKYDYDNPISTSNVNNINFGSAVGGTNLHAGLLKAQQLFQNTEMPDNAVKIVLILSDGQPTYYVYNNRNVRSYGNTTSLVTYNNTIAAAKSLQQTAEVFSIGYALSDEAAGSELNGKTAPEILQEVSTPDTGSLTHYLSSDLSSLPEVFNSMTEEIATQPAGTDAKTLSSVGQFFTFVEAQEGAVTYNENIDEVRCDIGTITSEAKGCSYVVKMEYDTVDNRQDGEWYPLTGDADSGTTLEYIDIDGNSNSLSLKNTVEVFAVRSKYDYEINYYKESIAEENLIERQTGNDYAGTIIKADTAKYLPDGYKLVSSISEISLSAEENEINIVYEKDETKTKRLSYTVEYYQDNVKISEDIYTFDVWINDSDIIYNQNVDISNDRYPGYKLGNVSPESVTSEIKNGEVIKIYYVKDEAKTKSLNYKINFYQGSEFVENKNVENEVWVNEMEVSADLVNLYKNKYVGYKLADEESIPKKIADGEIVNLYYIKDETQTKELNYTVEYYVDGSLESTEPIENVVWINDLDTLEVNNLANVETKYKGYKLANSNYKEIPEVVNTGDVIKLYYEKLYFEYKVEYYYDGVLDSDKTETHTAQYKTIIDTYRDKAYDNYEFDKVENTPLEIDVEGNVIKVYYLTGEPVIIVKPPHTGVKENILIIARVIIISLTAGFACLVLKGEKRK